MHATDTDIQMYVSAARMAVPTEYMYLVTRLFDVGPFSLVVLCLAILVYLVRGIRFAILLAVSIVSSSIVVLAIKQITHVARPIQGVIIVAGQSFPSWHATESTVLFIMLMYIFDDYFSPVGRVIFNTLCVAGIFIVALSRVYLGVHWSSDVLGGIIIGSILSYVGIIIFRRITQSQS